MIQDCNGRDTINASNPKAAITSRSTGYAIAYGTRANASMTEVRSTALQKIWCLCTKIIPYDACLAAGPILTSTKAGEQGQRALHSIAQTVHAQGMRIGDGNDHLQI